MAQAIARPVMRPYKTPPILSAITERPTVTTDNTGLTSLDTYLAITTVIAIITTNDIDVIQVSNMGA